MAKYVVLQEELSETLTFVLLNLATVWNFNVNHLPTAGQKALLPAGNVGERAGEPALWTRAAASSHPGSPMGVMKIA